MATKELGHEGGAGGSVAAPHPGPAPGLGPALMRAAWLAILLGLGFELVLLTVSVYGGSGAGLFVADLVKSVSWSVFVCVGLAVGTAISRARVPLMGLLGLLTAPLAFEVSRVLHKGTVEALALSGAADAAGTATFLLAAVKGARVRVPGPPRRVGRGPRLGRRGGPRRGGARRRNGLRRVHPRPHLSPRPRRLLGGGPPGARDQRAPLPGGLRPGPVLRQVSGGEIRRPPARPGSSLDRRESPWGGAAPRGLPYSPKTRNPTSPEATVSSPRRAYTSKA